MARRLNDLLDAIFGDAPAWPLAKFALAAYWALIYEGSRTQSLVDRIQPMYMRAKRLFLLEPLAKRAAPWLPSARLAYAWAIGGAIVAMALTYLYLAGNTGAHEANPVTAMLIPRIGWAGLLALKVGVVILDATIIFPKAVKNGESSWDGCSPEAALLWLWIGALVNGADAVWDLFITYHLPAPALTQPPTLFITTVLVATICAVYLGPPKDLASLAPEEVDP